MQSRIKNMISLGTFLSMMPDSVAKRVIFDNGYVPTDVRGIYKSSIATVVTLEFRVPNGADTQSFEVRWELNEAQMSYACYSNSQKRRLLDEESWRINLLSALRMGGSILRTRISTRTCDSLETQLETQLEPLLRRLE